MPARDVEMTLDSTCVCTEKRRERAVEKEGERREREHFSPSTILSTEAERIRKIARESQRVTQS